MHITPFPEKAALPGGRAEPLAIDGLRVQEAMARFAGNEDRYRYWLNEFVEHVPATCRQIRNTIVDGDSEAAARLIHALKGRAGMLGMSELHRTAQSLEAALAQSEASRTWLEKLESVAQQTACAIRTALASPPS